MENKYIPLYRKYRPQTFHDLIGQENIVHALSNAIKLNRISHAYLLCGPRGTGKTSSARILAKSLNCKEGPTLTPCGKCPACLDIMNSVPVDVIEIDAASNRSVEDTQAILEKIQYVPVNGRYKIYVIDEVHMLSNHAFNALLKTLEEPPENVIFILATTEPHKVLDTIISRCQRFDFRRITTDDIVKRLEYIAQQENINIKKEALYAIAKNSQGGMRDALALLDQISVLGVNKQVDVEDVNEILGKISYETLAEITQYIIDSDCTNAVPLIDKIYSKGNEPVQIVSNLIQYFRDLMIVRNCTDKELVYSLTRITESNYEKTKQQAEKFGVSEIIQIIDRLSYYSTQIKDTTNKYLWLEMCIIDLTNYKNLPSVENLLSRIKVLESKLADGNFSVKTQNQASAPIKRPIAQTSAEIQAQPVSAAPSIPVETAQIDNAAAQAEGKKEIERISESTEKTEKAPQKTEQKLNNTAPDDMHTTWVSIVQSIPSLPTRSFFLNLARPLLISNEKIVVGFTKEMFVKQASADAKKQALTEAAAAYLNIANPNIEIVLNDDIDLSKKMPAPIPVVSNKNQEEQDLRKQEEEEYHAFVESKKEENNKPAMPSNVSSQAEMVKELFNGKYVS